MARVVQRDGRGAAFRLPHEDFTSRTRLEHILKETTSLVPLESSRVDVYLDAGSLALIPAEARNEFALAETMHAAAIVITKLGYKRAIFAASSVPDTMVRHVKGTLLHVPRIEFRAWRKAMRDAESVHLQYGDYGVVYPGQVESDARVIPPSRIRITTDDEYVLYKGGRDEIRSLSAAALIDGALSRIVSWGANAVRECAAGYGDEGNAATWVARDTNMHIENTVAAIVRHMATEATVLSQITSVASGAPWLQDSLAFLRK